MRKLVPTGICHCGSEMEGHAVYDNHSPVELLAEEYRWYDRYLAKWSNFWFRLRYRKDVLWVDAPED
jgi:hypothetical protein